MRILVTGSSGQIGTNLCLALLERGDEVLGVDNRPNTWTTAVPTDLVDLVDLSSDVTAWDPPWRPECVVHLAAWAKVHQLVLEPGKALENVQMASAALEIARRAGSPIVFGSSREVYGDIHRHVTDEAMADFVVAESPYSASKIAGEAFVYSYAKCYGMPALVFRFSNVYGRYDNDLDRMERVIPLFLRRLAAGEPITVYGKDKMLDFTFVDDCVAGLLAGIDAIVDGKVGCETVNLAYGQGSTLLDLVHLLERCLGTTATATYEDPLVGEVTRYIADVSKARQLLGYDPQIPLAKGIPLYVDWWREQGLL